MNSAATPSNGGKGLCPPHLSCGTETSEHLPPPSEAREGPARLLESPTLGSYSPRAEPKFLPPTASDNLLSRSLSRPPSLLAPRKSLATACGPRAPHSPRGERSQSARRAREQPAGADGGASAELLTAAPAAPVADQAGKWEAAAGMSPAGSPTQLRDAAQRRPQPAR